MGTDQIETTALDALAAQAEAFSRTLRPRQLVGLTGPLGAGKTTFVKYVAKSLGISGEVISPTFMYEQVYPLPQPVRGIAELRHLDLYRIAVPEDLESLGIELSTPHGVSFVEWIERVPALASQADTTIAFTLNQEGRRFLRYQARQV